MDDGRLLTLGHPPSQLVVFGQDGILGRRAQLSEDCLGGAGAGGSLLENMREISQYLISYRVLAHRVILALAAVGRTTSCSFRPS